MAEINAVKVLFKYPFEDTFRRVWINNDLHEFQKLVEGFIEVVDMKDGVLLICNEEALFGDKKFNFKFKEQWFFGTVVLVGQDGEEFSDCPIDVNEANRRYLEWKMQ